MPVNFAAKFRYDILDTCLRNRKRVWTRKILHDIVQRKLEAKFGPDAKISQTQIYYDLLAMMHHFDAPIDTDKKNGKEHIYYYTIDWSINKMPITPRELDVLHEAAFMMKHQKGFSVSKALSEMYRKLENRYGSADPARPMVSFQKAPEVKGLHHLEPIFSFIKQKKAITIIHQSFGAAQPGEWLVHPYLLKEDDHRWYLLAYVPGKGGLRVFGLERIRLVQPTDEPYIESPMEDLEDYFRHVIGVTVLPSEEVEDIEMIFSPKMAHYIATRFLHHSQQTKLLEDGSLLASYKLQTNPELMCRILSYGPEVRVTKPQRLIDEIKTLINNTSNLYK